MSQGITQVRGCGAGEEDGDVGFAGDDLAVAVTGAVELPFPGDEGAASVEGGEEPPFPGALILAGESNIGEVQLDDVVTLAFSNMANVLQYRLERMVDELDDLDNTIAINVRGIAATTKRATLMSRNCGLQEDPRHPQPGQDPIKTATFSMSSMTFCKEAQCTGRCCHDAKRKNSSVASDRGITVSETRVPGQIREHWAMVLQDSVDT
ncbi:hypothetical protein LR48_Vigan09g247500 [Vigna angularis]|uniref:Uncharacterized protein n=1 Tax=Phaseolus angularis TaxID=3914 RepID=A0A0L9VFI0_PHAAN|nr:hypothetical protein LR48_Vigan09g247500 [Vigna angularis]